METGFQGWKRPSIEDIPHFQGSGLMEKVPHEEFLQDREELSKHTGAKLP